MLGKRDTVDDQTTKKDEPGRRLIFAALVEAQDGGMAVVASRTSIAKKFGVTPDEVSAIEKEGLQRQWPPL